MPKYFLARLRAGLSPDSTSLVRFIRDETFINLRKYSYKGHEYQQYFTELVEKDPNIDITTEKCSQIGLSEICFRIVLAQMALHPGYSIIYAMPSKTFSMEVLKTRIAPIIDQSPALNALISRNVDSASVKMFTNGSILFALGASANSSQSLINRPVTLAVTDELDKCDYDTHTGLRSRQTHSEHKPRIAISTPTAPGVGINAESENRQTHYQIVICSHCGHEFVPDYFEQVKVPGYEEPISTLTVDKVRSQELNIDDAYHHCPKCHKSPDLRPKFRKWLVDDQELKKIHVRLTPFDAPSFISPSDLVTSQLTYSNPDEHRNQTLGLPSKLSDATIDRSKITFTRDEVPDGLQVGGLDLGKTSHYMQASIKDNIIFVHNIERIELGDLEHRITYNIKANNLLSLVSDSLPFMDIVHRMTLMYQQFWGAIYTTPNQPQPELFKIKLREEDGVRQVLMQKNLFFDHLAGMLVDGQIVIKSSTYDEVILRHITDMRRVRDHRFSELRYKWMKSSKGVDHFFHTLAYLVCATKLIERTKFSTTMPLTNVLSSFKNKSDV